MKYPENDIATLRVTFTEIVDQGFPLCGAFVFSEVLGDLVVIHEKLPVLGVDYAEGHSNLPLTVDLTCRVVSTSGEGVVIDTSEPHGIQDIRGRTRFHVSADLLAG